jgi:hypothetical protein
MYGLCNGLGSISGKIKVKKLHNNFVAFSNLDSRIRIRIKKIKKIKSFMPKSKWQHFLNDCLI